MAVRCVIGLSEYSWRITDEEFCRIPARRSLGWVASASFIERTIRLLHSFIPTKKGTANAVPFGGDKGIRTPDLYVANVSRYQLCYIPEFIINFNSVT